jgi:acetoin utilization protein AcuB
MRHLPVVDQGRVVGVVTERDLYVMSLFPEMSFANTHVSLAMEQNLYVVTPSTTLREAAEGMAARYVGSALVVDEGNLVGIFTEADAVKMIAYA